MSPASPTSTWPALLKGTLRFISLIVIPKPAFTFPASNPATAIPIYRTNMRNTIVGAPSTPLDDITLSLFDHSQSVYNNTYGPMSSTPLRPDLDHDVNKNRRERERCCCACHNPVAFTLQPQIHGSGRSSYSADRPMRRHPNFMRYDPPSPTPSPRPRLATKPDTMEQGQRQSPMIHRNKLNKPSPRPRKSGRWGQSNVMATVSIKDAMLETGNASESFITDSNVSRVGLDSAEDAPRRRSLRRSKRIVGSTITEAGMATRNQNRVTNGMNDTQDDSNHVAEPQSLYKSSPSPKVQQPQVVARSRSHSIASQSRFFELDLSPIIEDAHTLKPAEPLPLAPSVIIKGERAEMLTHSSTGEVSPRSCSSFGDALVFMLTLFAARSHGDGEMIPPIYSGLRPADKVLSPNHVNCNLRACGSLEESEIGDVTNANEISQDSGNANADGNGKGAPSVGAPDDGTALIPTVILTYPTPDLSTCSPTFAPRGPTANSASVFVGHAGEVGPPCINMHPGHDGQRGGPRDFGDDLLQPELARGGPHGHGHGTPTSGPRDLDLDMSRGLGFAVDELGVVAAQSRDEGPDGDGDTGMKKTLGRAGGPAQGYTSRARAALFPFRRSLRLSSSGRGRGRGRRAWDAISRFFSSGRSRGRSGVSSISGAATSVSVSVSVSGPATGQEDNHFDVTVANEGCRRGEGLDVSFETARSRWFGSSPRHVRVRGSAAAAAAADLDMRSAV
ncbi:hypothetical protein D9615_000894 [Tricholomella constricta]|uniref:Uncharacterized protein n=1 Tax=Tricholomella constricta TaxID=117010 RepID=A0A8H5HKQ7_9AGAR|nr:hypothetical protein D9615_000894 [Tricholomella constricta]